MDITWLGHSCFRLHFADMVVITDPFPASIGLKPDSRPASVVTISNPHPNHSNWKDVEGDPKVFLAPGEYEYNGITVRGIMTRLLEETPQEQRNVAFSSGKEPGPWDLPPPTSTLPSGSRIEMLW